MINVKLQQILLLISAIFYSVGTNAQKLDQTFGDWNVLTTTVDAKKICYAASLPVKQEGTAKGDANAYILVSLFPDRSPEVSYSPGFAIKADDKVKVDIDGMVLFLPKISEQIAWTENSEQDKSMIIELKKGIKLKIMAPDSKGTYSLDTFSLKGFTAAYNHMLSLCKDKE